MRDGVKAGSGAIGSLGSAWRPGGSLVVPGDVAGRLCRHAVAHRSSHIAAWRASTPAGWSRRMSRDRFGPHALPGTACSTGRETVKTSGGGRRTRSAERPRRGRRQIAKACASPLRRHSSGRPTASIAEACRSSPGRSDGPAQTRRMDFDLGRIGRRGRPVPVAASDRRRSHERLDPLRRPGRPDGEGTTPASRNRPSRSPHRPPDHGEPFAAIFAELTMTSKG